MPGRHPGHTVVDAFPVIEDGDREYATPEEAAVAAFPRRYVRVSKVIYSRSGDQAEVALLTNEERYLYPYYVQCVRDRSGLWVETEGHN